MQLNTSIGKGWAPPNPKLSMLLFLGLFASSLRVYAGAFAWNGSSGDWHYASNRSPLGYSSSADDHGFGRH